MKLVTGGFGFIGNELVRQLSANTDVAVLDNRYRIAPRIEDISGIPCFDVDIRDHIRTREVIAKLKPDTVFHLAALHYIPECNQNPEQTLRLNLEATLGLLRACSNAGVRHFLFASSGAVYADSSDLLTENSPPAPVDIYGWSKLFSEQICQWHSQSTGLPVTICRLFNVFGPRETNPHIIPEIINQLKSGKRRIKLGRTDTIRDYIYVEDMAHSLSMLASNPPTTCRIVNVSSGFHCTVGDLVNLMSGIFQETITIEHDATRLRKADKMVQRSDLSLLKKLTGYAPATSIENGLRRIMEFEGLI